eukprot:765394-Hanusia_phi.AAC.2
MSPQLARASAGLSCTVSCRAAVLGTRRSDNLIFAVPGFYRESWHRAGGKSIDVPVPLQSNGWTPGPVSRVATVTQGPE